MKKIVIFGWNGLLGRHLYYHLLQNKFRIITIGRHELSDYVLQTGDISEVIKILRFINPSVVINLIAATDVDRCEREISYAFLANTGFPFILSSAINSILGSNIHLIHISTDQVYSGSGPHKEDATHPINIYGFSKFMGEIAISWPKSTILRTNFYGRSIASTRSSFTDWIVSSLQAGTPIKLFKDVLMSGLNIGTLCDFIVVIIHRPVYGIYNLGSSDMISKADFALKMAKKLKLSTENLEIVSIDNVPKIAKRPKDMSLNVNKIQTALSRNCPKIDDEIDLTVKEYLHASPIK